MTGPKMNLPNLSHFEQFTNSTFILNYWIQLATWIFTRQRPCSSANYIIALAFVQRNSAKCREKSHLKFTISFGWAPHAVGCFALDGIKNQLSFANELLLQFQITFPMFYSLSFRQTQEKINSDFRLSSKSGKNSIIWLDFRRTENGSFVANDIQEIWSLTYHWCGMKNANCAPHLIFVTFRRRIHCAKKVRIAMERTDILDEHGAIHGVPSHRIGVPNRPTSYEFLCQEVCSNFTLDAVKRDCNVDSAPLRPMSLSTPIHLYTDRTLHTA